MPKNDDYDSLLKQQEELRAKLAPQQRVRHATLREQRDAIEAQLAPLYAEIEDPNCTRAREADLRSKIKDIRGPMAAIDEELSSLTADLKGKTGVPAEQSAA